MEIMLSEIVNKSCCRMCLKEVKQVKVLEVNIQLKYLTKLAAAHQCISLIKKPIEF